EEIADEEDSQAEAEDGVVEPQVVGHAQLRHADVDAVDVRDGVEQEEVRKEAPRDLADDPALERSGVRRGNEVAGSLEGGGLRQGSTMTLLRSGVAMMSMA